MISSFLSWFFLPRNYRLMWKSILHHMSQQASGTNTALLVSSSDLQEPFFFNAPPSHHTTSPKPCPKRSRAASRPKDVVEFAEDELHRLVLVNHIHRHVAVVPLWAHQGRPKDNADVLCGHSVGIWVFQDSAANKRVESFRYNNFHVNRHHRQQKQLQTEFDICAKITSISGWQHPLARSFKTFWDSQGALPYFPDYKCLQSIGRTSQIIDNEEEKKNIYKLLRSRTSAL